MGIRTWRRASDRGGNGGPMSIGGIEAGGTRWTCAVGDGDGGIERVESFATATPAATLGRATRFFAAVPDLEAVGVGAFGPVEVNRSSPRWGTITTTPKPGWADTDLVGPLAEALGVPIALDTDVNAAAVGEWARGAVFANGRPVHGLLHPELGHVMVPHDRTRDPFEGSCPFHGDCLEGLASGTALRARWGRPGEELSDPEVWDLEAEYLALGLANVVLVVAAERIV